MKLGVSHLPGSLILDISAIKTKGKQVPVSQAVYVMLLITPSFPVILCSTILFCSGNRGKLLCLNTSFCSTSHVFLTSTVMGSTNTIQQLILDSSFSLTAFIGFSIINFHSVSKMHQFSLVFLKYSTTPHKLYACITTLDYHIRPLTCFHLGPPIDCSPQSCQGNFFF